MTRAQQILASLESQAMAELEPAYLRALTAQIKGKDPREEWAEFQKMLTRAIVLANLCGRWGVCSRLRVPIIPEPVKKSQVASYADKPIITAPFDAAINWFRNKVPALRRVVDTLLPAARAKAFWVTGIESKEALQRIQDRLTRPLMAEGPVTVQKPSGKMGTQLPGSQEAFIKAEEAATGLARARLETVYRTNVQGALNEGSRDMMNAPEMRSGVALIQLNEIHDTRTRGAPGTGNPGHHWQMDGFVEAPDHPIWMKITPPCGFNCRGSISPVSWLTAERMGLAKDGKLLRDAIDKRNASKWKWINEGKYPDPGFKT